MEHKIKKFLFDIKESIKSIESYLGDKRDFNVYQSNKMLRRAIEREFEIIGEAMTRIEKLHNKLLNNSNTKYDHRILKTLFLTPLVLSMIEFKPTVT